MEIQYRSHIKDRNGVTFIAIINPVPNIFTSIWKKAMHRSMSKRTLKIVISNITHLVLMDLWINSVVSF